MHDAIVIGGGVVGASAAYHLARGGANVLLIDRHHTGRATDAGAGILSDAVAGTRLGPDWFTLSMAAMDDYPALIDRQRLIFRHSTYRGSTRDIGIAGVGNVRFYPARFAAKPCFALSRPLHGVERARPQVGVRSES